MTAFLMLYGLLSDLFSSCKILCTLATNALHTVPLVMRTVHTLLLRLSAVWLSSVPFILRTLRNSSWAAFSITKRGMVIMNSKTKRRGVHLVGNYRTFHAKTQAIAPRWTFSAHRASRAGSPPMQGGECHSKNTGHCLLLLRETLARLLSSETLCKGLRCSQAHQGRQSRQEQAP